MSKISYNIVPNHLSDIYSFDKNPNIRDHLEKDQYDMICSLSNDKLNKWYKTKDFKCAIEKSDIFDISKLNFFGEFIEEITSCEHTVENSFPFHVTILNDGLLTNFINPNSFLDKIFSTDKRYVSFIIDFVSDLKTVGHAALFVVDKFKGECYVIDPNGSMNYFNSLIDDFKCDYFLHKIFESYAKKIGFEYVDLINKDIDLVINIKINSKKQRDFFKGYCKGWALYFQYVLHEAPDDFEMVTYLKNLATYVNLGPMNELVEIFQVWFINENEKIRLEALYKCAEIWKTSGNKL